MEKILFLDIDGVFIPTRMFFSPTQTYPIYRTFCPGVVGMVNDIAKETGCKFVVHSSWVRTSFSVPNTRDHMIEQGLKAEYFHEDWSVKYTRTGSRWNAILDWIGTNKYDYLILDDDPSPEEFEELHSRHIDTDFADGMLFKHYEQIMERWKCE